MRAFLSAKTYFLISFFVCNWHPSSCFSLLLMARKGNGKLKRELKGLDTSQSVSKFKTGSSLTERKGRELKGVTLPVEVCCFCYRRFCSPIRVMLRMVSQTSNSYYATVGKIERLGVVRWFSLSMC